MDLQIASRYALQVKAPQAIYLQCQCRLQISVDLVLFEVIPGPIRKVRWLRPLVNNTECQATHTLRVHLLLFCLGKIVKQICQILVLEFR